MRPSLNLELREPVWLALLRAEHANGRSISSIARLCGMARPSVSMLLAGTYPARSLDFVERRHGAAIVDAFLGRVLCPHLRTDISASQCRAYADAPMSVSNVARMRHYEACRRCPLNIQPPAEGDVK